MMQINPNQRPSPWGDGLSMPVRMPLTKDLHADVCVIGAGIAGMTTAYCLAKEKLSVVVLEQAQIGAGETGRTTAHLTHAMDDRFFNLEKLHGVANSRLIAESHTAAIDRIERIQDEEAIDCDFSRLDGYLFLMPGESAEVLTRERDAAHRAGLRAVNLLAGAPIKTFNTGPALLFPSQAQFHPLKYLLGLYRAIGLAGGRIFTGTQVKEVQGGNHAYVRTADGRKVHANSIVVATNSPIVSPIAVASRQAGYTTYAIAATVAPGSLERALYWDTGDPYHYIRLHTAGGTEMLLVGGEDHKTGQGHNTEEPWQRLERWTRARFDIRPVAFRWSGEVMEPMDDLAYIGRNPLDDANVYIATGDSGQGMTHGTIAGMLLTDLIMQRSNPWADLYAPSRMRLQALGQFARENLNAVAQYTSWIDSGDVSRPEDIPLDSGGILRRGLSKIAAYRDSAGVVHETSAVCPHLGCHVEWNNGEKTWDCPCHGSRFDRYGELLHGPASRGLSRLAPEQENKKKSA
jgi:glycine/D-amino acid oxidase-like deaminating enzyme/nitrite reductase/ring-hydroxylating ferredoxin subunit